MRTTTILSEAQFAKPGEPWRTVALPHTWNAQDGQDGGNDYWRGTARYRLRLPAHTLGKRQFVRFHGANHVANVSCNGQPAGSHAGGFSAFCLELTKMMQVGENLLEVEVDNYAPEVYPQKADFTFFGGLYRSVEFIETEQAHLELTKDGSGGVFVTPDISGAVRMDIFAVMPEKADCTVKAVLTDHTGTVAAAAEAPAGAHTVLEMKVDEPHLWRGLADPCLYTAQVMLLEGESPVDEVSVRFGYREFTVDAEKGFFLNGQPYPLHGVSRHQDRQDKGWAVSESDHLQDMAFIQEIGANTVRLAHYQHDQYFYDLCDEKGLIVWAEIPFISQLIEGDRARQNTLDQMRELIVQNYNHPSICFWGIGNELTMGGDSDALFENLQALHALAKQLDPSRLTALAQLSTVGKDHRHIAVSDVQGYNIYMGWYTGDIQDNGPFLDAWHSANPDCPLAVTEYGADALTTWHSAAPKNHDYTEEYQALYHEGLMSAFASRPWIFATWVWNMFDFAADARNEGGCKGRNCKGLVSYDRNVKKDAFYLYKAWWNPAPMVHICGMRFCSRAPGERDVKVFTNASMVTLRLNGQELLTKAVQNHAVLFEDVPLEQGENVLEAMADNGATDSIRLYGVVEADSGYVMPQEELVAGNWFDEETGETLKMEYPEGYFSVRDTLGDLLQHPEGPEVLAELQGLMGRSGVTAGNKESGDGAASQKGMLQSVAQFPFQQILKMLNLPPQTILKVNCRLNQIRKQ